MKSKNNLVVGSLISLMAGLFILFSGNHAHANVLYTVKNGDSVLKIDKKFGINSNASISKSYSACHTKNHKYIKSGDRVTVVTVVPVKYIKPATPKEIKTLPVVTGQPKIQSSNGTYVSKVAGSEAAAKLWIAYHESGNRWNARNGQYIGKYQITASYLHGDYSRANQERVVDQYVKIRYKTWKAAKIHWLRHHWY